MDEDGNNNMSNITIEHPEWGDDILRNKENGKIWFPMELARNVYVVIFDCVNGSVALPLNVYVGSDTIEWPLA
jgi:hypothetical protein